MWILSRSANGCGGRKKGFETRRARFEPLEMRTLLSVSPASGIDDFGPDPAVTALAAPRERPPAPPDFWTAALTPEQAQMREEVHALVSRGGKVAELENFQPVRMPEAVLEDLYDSYGVRQTWESLRGSMGELFGDYILLKRRDTPGDFTGGTPWRDSLTPEQAQVREEVLSVVSRGGKSVDLEDFQPVRMPEAFLDELYDTYGVKQTVESLKGHTDELFGAQVFSNRGDTTGEFYDDFRASGDTSWIDSLTTEQAQVREDLRALRSQGGTIDQLPNFQPVLMPEAFLDELYDTYGVTQTWESLHGVMNELFDAQMLLNRRDTPGFFDDPQSNGDAAWIEALSAEQARVRGELHALLGRGGNIAELENFQPVLMPEAFLDELYDTYGVTQTWESLHGVTNELFDEQILLNRRDTPGFFDDPQSNGDAAWIDALNAEQAQIREDLHALLGRGGNIAELENFQPVLMPEAFLDELYDTYGLDTVWDSLGRHTMASLFGEILDSRSDTRVFAYDPPPVAYAAWIEALSAEQAQVRGELHALLGRGGNIAELENFQPMLMPEAFLDELYGTYGVTRTWDFLGGETLSALFGDRVLLNRGDTPMYVPEHIPEPWPNPNLELHRHDAGSYADNGVADYFDVTRSGDDLVLTISEDTDPTEGVSLVTRSIVTLDAKDALHLYVRGSSDIDFYRVHNLGDFSGEVTIEGTIPESVADAVQIYDTEGDDVWHAGEKRATFIMEDAYRVIAHNVGGAKHGYANAGGNDKAYLGGSDSPNRAKVFEHGANLARLFRGGVYHRAKFFDSVEIGGGGSNDTAIFYGTPGNDQFKANRRQGEFKTSHHGGASCTYQGFEKVIASGGAGIDRAHFTDSELAEVVRVRPWRADVKEIGHSKPYLTMRGFDSFYAQALTDDGKTDIIKMHDTDAIDLLTAEMDDGHVRARFYRDPSDFSNPTAVDLIYESLGFEVTKGYSTSVGDKKDTDGVDPALLAWSGDWKGI